MSEHTSEPWVFEIDEDGDCAIWATVDSDNGYPLFYNGENRTVEEMSLNGARVVSCVNACAGINPEVVPLLVRAVRLEDGWRKAGSQKEQDAMRIQATDVREKAMAMLEGGDA